MKTMASRRVWYLRSAGVFGTIGLSLWLHQNASWTFEFLKSKQEPILSPNRFQLLPVLKREQITPTLWHVRIGLNVEHLPSIPSQVVYHINIAEPASHSYRPFTPIDRPSIEKPYLDLLVRRYPWPYGEVARHATSTERHLLVQGPLSTCQFQAPVFPHTKQKAPIVMVSLRLKFL